MRTYSLKKGIAASLVALAAAAFAAAAAARIFSRGRFLAIDLGLPRYGRVDGLLPALLVFLAVLLLLAPLLWRAYARKSHAEFLAPGLYHYYNTKKFGARRLHLRVERDGSAILMVDAYRVVHLNATAAAMVKYFLDDFPAAGKPPAAGRRLPRQPRPGRARHPERAGEDRPAGQPRRRLPADLFRHRQDRGLPNAGLGPLSHGPGPDLPLQHQLLPLLQPAPRIQRSSRPASGKRPCASSGSTASRTSTSPAASPPCATTWSSWSHIAEDLGAITGLLTNGVRLADADYVRQLKQAGLDYVQVTLESARAEVHDRMVGAETFALTVQGIRNAVAAGIHVLTNTTITRANREHVEEIVPFLKSLGTSSFAVNSIIRAGKSRRVDRGLSEEELLPLLRRLQRPGRRRPA